VLLADCIHATRFITKSQEEALIDALSHLCSKYQAERLRENNIVAIDRVKSKNTSMTQTIDKINEAIKVGCKITMRYLKHTLKDKENPVERRKEPYKLSPFKLIMNDGFYYLLAYSDEKERIMTFRLDRMTNVKLTAEAREGEKLFREIGMSGFTKRVFNMFRGRTEHVGIRFRASKLDTVIDRFGTGGDVMYTPLDAHHFMMRTDIEISDSFFSWISGFRGGAVLVEPKNVVEEYKAFLKDNAKYHDMYLNE
jgi:predicted DNA-binding transcriptional regulator YafY